MEKMFKVLDYQGKGINFKEYQKSLVYRYNATSKVIGEPRIPEDATKFEYKVIKGIILIKDAEGLVNVIIKGKNKDSINKLKETASWINYEECNLEEIK